VFGCRCMVKSVGSLLLLFPKAFRSRAIIIPGPSSHSVRDGSGTHCFALRSSRQGRALFSMPEIADCFSVVSLNYG
jgi:hypothetical protein